MADFVLKNAFLSVNGVNLSDHVRSLTLNYDAEMQDNSAMGDVSRSNLAGLIVKSMSVDFYQDEAAAKVGATLFPLVGAAAFAVAIRQDAGAISTTNPEYQWNALLEKYPIVAGEVGTMAMAAVTFQSGDGAAMLRDVTP